MRKVFSRNITQLFVIVCLIISVSFNANSVVRWAAVYGGSGYGWYSRDEAYSIKQTIDSGYIVASRSGGDCLILKLDRNGDIQWQKTYGGSGGKGATSIQQTSDGGYVVAGQTYSNSESYNIWILKLYRNGDIQWQKTYGGSGSEGATSIQQTSDDGYVVAGWAYSDSESYNIWILKLYRNGDIQWQKAYGGSGGEKANSIQQTSDGGYVVAGYTTSFIPWTHDYWILKLDSNGDIQWQKRYSNDRQWQKRFTGNDSSENAYSIQQTRDGGYVVAGSTHLLDTNNDDYWVLKLDRDGNVQWQKRYSSRQATAYSIQQTSDGGYVVAGRAYSEDGETSSNMWVLKLGRNGDIQWQKTYGGSKHDSAISIQQTIDSGYIVAGYTTSFGAGGRNYLMILKLDSDGKINPSCSEEGLTIESTNIIGQDTSTKVINTSISPTDTNVTPTITTAKITGTDVIRNLICPPIQSPVLIPYEPDPTNNTTPTLDWQDVSGASAYYIQIDDNSDFSSPIVDEQLTESQDTPGSPLPEGTIQWRVSSIDGDGNESDFSDADDFTIDLTPPAIPTLIAYTPDKTNNQKPTLDWKDVTDTTAYHLQIDDNEEFSDPILDESSLTASKYTTISDLPEGVIYWRVGSIDAAGNESEYSQVDNFTIDISPPAVPTSLEAVAGESQVSLNWNANTEPDLSHYKIYRSETQGFTPTQDDFVHRVDKSDTSYLDTGLTNGTTYYYHISAVDNVGNESGFSAGANATPNVSPPKNLTISFTPEKDKGIVDLSWEASEGEGITSYNVYRSTSEFEEISNLTPIGTDIQETKYQDVLTSWKGYYYAITAVDALGNESSLSNIAHIKDYFVSSPKNLTISLTPERGKGTVNLSWQAQENEIPYDIVAYSIYRSTSSFEEISNLKPISTDVKKTEYQDFLQKSNDYYYAVIAIDEFGNESGMSDVRHINYKRPEVFLSIEDKAYLGNIFTIELKTENMFDLYGFQFDLVFEPDLLKVKEVTEGTFLKQNGVDTFWQEAEIDRQEGTIRNASAIRLQKSGVDGDGVLANVSFKAISPKTSTLRLENVKFTNPNAEPITIVKVEDSLTLTITVPWDVKKDGIIDVFDLALVGMNFGEEIPPDTEPNPDVNRDGVVNIFDLVLVGSHFGEKAAPSIHNISLLQQIYDTLKTVPNPNQNLKLALKELEKLLAPKETALLRNYPNPFNPETWIPFKLSNDANVVISIYDISGQLVRKIGLGNTSAGMYLNKEKAVYWDGRNSSGEKVSSGLYFYTLHAGDYSATKRMLILK